MPTSPETPEILEGARPTRRKFLGAAGAGVLAFALGIGRKAVAAVADGASHERAPETGMNANEILRSADSFKPVAVKKSGDEKYDLKFFYNGRACAYVKIEPVRFFGADKQRNNKVFIFHSAGQLVHELRGTLPDLVEVVCFLAAEQTVEQLLETSGIKIERKLLWQTGESLFESVYLITGGESGALVSLAVKSSDYKSGDKHPRVHAWVRENTSSRHVKTFVMPQDENMLKALLSNPSANIALLEERERFNYLNGIAKDFGGSLVKKPVPDEFKAKIKTWYKILDKDKRIVGYFGVPNNAEDLEEVYIYDLGTSQVGNRTQFETGAILKILADIAERR